MLATAVGPLTTDLIKAAQASVVKLRAGRLGMDSSGALLREAMAMSAATFLVLPKRSLTTRAAATFASFASHHESMPTAMRSRYFGACSTRAKIPRPATPHSRFGCSGCKAGAKSCCLARQPIPPCSSGRCLGLGVDLSRDTLGQLVQEFSPDFMWVSRSRPGPDQTHFPELVMSGAYTPRSSDFPI
jgi:hypothetical protein